MRKIKYSLLFIILFFITVPVLANSLSSIKINANFDKNGTLHVNEIWNMQTDSKTEIYKEEYNLGNMEITNFKVSDEARTYTYNSNWNINASFSEKKYSYGINEVSQGIELCWGISEYGNKVYNISYDLEKAIFNTSDAQVFYTRLINDLDFPPKSFEIVISGPEKYPDTLDVWGYGYKGYAYVQNGKIYMSNEENTPLSKGDYGVILIKFPLNTFTTTNSYEEYPNFDAVLNKAESGSYDYDYDDDNFNIIEIIIYLFRMITFPLVVGFLIYKAVTSSKYKFGEAGKKINMKEINMFRDIPCKKNIYRAYFLAQAYNLNKKNTDFLGSVFLKWIVEDEISIVKETKTGFLGKKSEAINLDLRNAKDINPSVELDMFNYIKTASEDGILEENELKKWSKNNYDKILSWFDEAEKYGRDLYVTDGLISKEKGKYLINDQLKHDAIELAGLKKYLKEFTLIHEKQPIEVKLWKEYLMYAQIFGMANEVAKQFKDLYPEIVAEMNNNNYDLNTFIIINNLSRTAVVNASSARTAAESYNSGGGGFSSGGGGGGSFGGGGGGAR